MALKPSITLRMGQQLRMTPQLQQAIRLLQLSTLELEVEIQEDLDSNFMLEEIDQNAADGENEDATSPDEIADVVDNIDVDPDIPESGTTDDAADSNDFEEFDLPNPELDGDTVPDTSEEVSSETLLEELPVDTTWDDVFDESFQTSTPGSDFSDENYLETRNADSTTIQSHLMEQINLLNFTETDEYIALSIIDGLDEDGILQIDIQDIVDSAPAEWGVELDEVEAVLHLIQHLDPVGIASRSLQECLAIQLRQLPPETASRDVAIIVVEQYINLLAGRDYSQLARKVRIKEEQLKEVIELIQSLDPRPGSGIAQGTTDYVEPDVIVSKQNGRWMVELNPKSTPRIRVNPEYAALIQRGDSSDGGTQLKNHLQEAKWFIKSLQQRNDTLLRVSTKIVEYQRGFLEYGEQAMKPLVLHDIAEAVDLHESTISRVTTQKYMLTPSGVFELKYFFSSHVSTNSGGEVSSTAIRALIKKLVSEENPQKPLSDSKIAKLLEEQNINVARRTIAKYRELLLIPPSNERKELI
jgi:RNA polymerase sigma-54 factor